ncbi:hypothetical protein COCCADRAFT_82621 [Bipolaris zeicola 26-R-13]|uniref:Uncharacterized protein n=1 Tax=Cochliobolus carbonum (strain 26-R-13) TaxID=930089 RepID=W6YGH7_COCC2|nr:uncharacterized protein COCCADRAFT_82621 [Bipolaris zeicola 26-R-13]EUC38632.1 hypothetical protein COCCADRAFT_82621 [Bipolaris zeicola 26-R-13]
MASGDDAETAAAAGAGAGGAKTKRVVGMPSHTTPTRLEISVLPGFIQAILLSANR